MASFASRLRSAQSTTLRRTRSVMREMSLTPIRSFLLQLAASRSRSTHASCSSNWLAQQCAERFTATAAFSCAARSAAPSASSSCPPSLAPSSQDGSHEDLPPHIRETTSKKYVLSDRQPPSSSPTIPLFAAPAKDETNLIHLLSYSRETSTCKLFISPI